jgi:uncharacterized protein
MIVDTEVDELITPRTGSPGPGQSSIKRRTHFWLRWAHVYIGMFSLLIVLFFGITGITLNGPSWTFGGEISTESFTGELPSGALAGGVAAF